MAEDFSKILRFVRTWRRRFIANAIGRDCVVAFAAFIGIAALLQLVFAFFPWIVLPALFDIAAVALALSIAASLLCRAFFFAPSLLETAVMIERRSGLKNPLLAVAMELSSNEPTRDNPFTGAACTAAAASLGKYPSAPRVTRRTVFLGAAATCLALWCAFNPVLSPRLFSYLGLPFSAISRFNASVSPGSIEVPMDAPVDLKLTTGARFPSCRLLITELGGERKTGLFLRPDHAGSFSFHMDHVKCGFAYRFDIMGRSAGGTDTIIAVPPPRLHRMRVTMEPPAYTKLAPRTLPDGQGDFEAYAGTRVRIAIESDRLKRADLVCGHDTVALAVKGTQASGAFNVVTPCDYSFILVDTLGQNSGRLPAFHIGCIADAPPAVQIFRPGRNKDLQTDQLETLAVEGVDDLGIQAMSLNWKCGGELHRAGKRDLLEGRSGTDIRSLFVWHLNELSLYPGDTVRYWAQAIDTRPFGAPGRASSDTFWFRIPNFEEIYKRMASQQDNAEKILDKVQSSRKGIADQLDQAMKSSQKGRKELSWEQRQALKDVKQQAQAQTDSLRQSIQALKENIDQMRQQGSIGEELAQKFEQVRKAVEDLVKQFGDSLLFNMKDFDKPVSADDIRKAVDQTRAELPKLAEQLDNTLKFLKMLKEDRKLSELAMRAEALSKEQSLLARNAEGRPVDPRLEHDLLDRIQKLSRDASAQVGERNTADDRRDSLPSRRPLDSLGREMEAGLNRADPPSRESMDNMSGSLLSLSQELMQMMNFGEGRRREKERERLIALADGARAMAEWQQELERQSQGSRNREALARGQQALRDALRQSKKSADSLSMIPPDQMAEIGKGFMRADRSTEQALQSMSSHGPGTRESMQGSVSALRSYANTFLAALAQMNNGQQQGGSGGSGMMQGLRKLSGRQALINGATSSLLSSLLKNSPSGQGNGSGRSEAARRAAQNAQREIADELKNLADKYGNEPGNEGLGSRVNALEKEARKLAEMLDHPRQEITEKQDRLLSRMLETTLSMHRQEEGKNEYKSKSVDNPFQEGITVQPGTIFRDRDSFNRLRLQAFKGNYPDAYREALLKYFEALSAKYLK